MTISFHHHLRAGDMVLPKVMEAIDELGIKDLTICASSLTSSHECLIDYIKRGVVTSLQTSGMRGELGKQVSKGLLDTAVVFRTHGGRARAIQKGDVTIDVAFIAASCCDDMGNMNGQQGPSAFGSMGYAMVDARYAKKVVAVTDNLVDFPAYPVSIPQTLVDIVAEIDQIGDPELMGQGATRKTKSPLELTIAEYASKVLIASGLIKNGFSYQAGTGGVSLAVVRFLRDYMKENHIIGSFGSGGITSTMVELLNEGLFTGLLDVQTFDKGDFDIKTYANRSFGVYQNEEMKVELLFCADVAEDVLNYNFHPTQKVKRNENGTVTVKFKASGELEILWHLFKWGDAVKIISPRSLKKEYIEMLENVLEMQKG